MFVLYIFMILLNNFLLRFYLIFVENANYVSVISLFIFLRLPQLLVNIKDLLESADSL